MIKVYTDASTKGNPGPSGAGIVIIGESIYKQLHFPLPLLSNHEAEFEAVSLAIRTLLDFGWQDQTIMLYTDSKVVAQTIDKNHTNNPKFSNYLHEISQNIQKFPLFIVQWIPERENKGADHLARQGLQKALKKEN